MKISIRKHQWILVALCAAITCMTMLSSCGDDEDVKKVTKERTGTIGGHDYVDLGLPSGTLWATCNIGAKSPEDFGYYFAWGETTGYGAPGTYNAVRRHFNWETYKWYNEENYRWFNVDGLTKYCNITDTKTELDPEDDAAYVNWGSQWRMPSITQIEELINGSYTTMEETDKNGVNGWRITSKANGNTIFLPDTGYLGDEEDMMESGCYWSRTLEPVSWPMCAVQFDIKIAYNNRCAGHAIRPVCIPL